MRFVEGNIIDDKYTVMKKIGKGGFGEVLQVSDIYGREKALKFCSSKEEVDIRRFQREVRITKDIKHKNVVEILDYNLEHSPPYFIMPLAKYSLTDLIPSIKSDFSKTLEIFEELCKGVKAIHMYDRTHRDIKPGNVLIMENEVVVVTDLGLAKFNERESTVLTKASINIGTADYAPPEQYEYGGTRDLDSRGDIFMLGKTLYEMLTSNTPRIMNPTAVEPGLWFIIQKATKHNRYDRYQTIDDMLDSLNQFRSINDPHINPELMFENLTSIAKEKLKENEYDPENLSEMIGVINTFEDSNTFLKYFHSIPYRLMPILAREEFSDSFELVMLKYYLSIKDVIGEYSFEFAESVGERVVAISSNTNSPIIKKYCLLSVLIASVVLNRFAAMGDFDNLLLKIESNEDAYPIGEGLQEEIYYYQSLYERIPRDRLHPVLQAIWDQCAK